MAKKQSILNWIWMYFHQQKEFSSKHMGVLFNELAVTNSAIYQ